ncbi:MAG: citramalate synthase [Desulfobacterales bacterium]|nr:citramalate synthase [Desulfobacterales bacterium]
MKPIIIYDTTLRDGMQGEHISFGPGEKIRIAKRLDDIGVHYIEGGWPGSNPAAIRFFEMAKEVQWKQAKLSAFGSTRKPCIQADEDANLQALIAAETPAVTIFGKSWTLHVQDIMNNTLQENLAMIEDSVAFLKHHGREVIYDAEHFFDGFFENQDYALETLKAAVRGGTRTIVLCDTNGGTLPQDIETITRMVDLNISMYCDSLNQDQSIQIGIHTHNDCGLAIANSIAAVRSGAGMVQGTINGYGERCGNADLISIIPLLSIKMNYSCISPENLKKLRTLSRFVSEMANMTPQPQRPFVGRSAFAHKGGIHVSAIMKNPKAYEHMDPELVGNERRVLVSEQSGKSNIIYKAKELGIDLGSEDIDMQQIVSTIKTMEDQGYQFEAADASFKILLEKLANQFSSAFDLESFRVTIEKDKTHHCKSHATVKVCVNNQMEITAAEGHGPVSALDNALRKALGSFFPELNQMHLVDFKVRVIDGKDGTSAKVRVLIESRDEDHIWSTIGVSEDIIEASWQALSDSFLWKLNKRSLSEQTNNGVIV